MLEGRAVGRSRAPGDRRLDFGSDAITGDVTLHPRLPSQGLCFLLHRRAPSDIFTTCSISIAGETW